MMLARLGRFRKSIRTNKTVYPGDFTAKGKRFLHGFDVAENRPTSIDPFSYTSGRWLKCDSLQRKARHINFDYRALCQKAVEACPGASEIVRHEKNEGAFNRVFILHMDDGQRVVARIPFRLAGPRRLATQSEVASMTYLRQYTNIPIPKVLDWNDDETNTTGTEYIIMEHASGVQLHGKWSSMSTHQHMLCVKSLATLVKEMMTLNFPAFGSIYFADAPIEPAIKIRLAEGFCIGPHCGAPVWPCSPVELSLYGEKMSRRGPWSDIESYCSGLIDAGYRRLPDAEPAVPRLDYQGTVQEHLRLIKASDEVIRKLITSSMLRNISTPLLLHPDLHKRNIYVSDGDPTQIVALIDWQATCIEPLFSYASEMPDLITSPMSIPISAGTEDVPALVENQEKTKVEKDVSICQQTFEVAMKAWAPRFHDARVTDETILRVLRYCSTSWRDSAAALRQELIELSQRWTALGLAGSCPYQPTAEEIQNHRKQYEDFESLQRLKLFLIRATNSNSGGWVPSDHWDAANEAHQLAYEEWMQTARDGDESEMTEEKAKKMWPFDPPRGSGMSSHAAMEAISSAG
ncbi:kinase-like domain-containing protein [Lineolata rhizophorae]|uniref:Altered inheritance of mitochondria protein 9, mitochondrial n=1 Tax=Lineolata rhizophorae TaxID=578093 RepID=A0A6A6NKJ8_9PEZI|nr:kinase-like domain-containing protein [Lineolata rhizophorae]